MKEDMPKPTIREKIRRLDQTRKTILQLPPEKALERILEADNPAALLHAFPEQDFYFLVQDVGPEDSLPLLSLASDRQWEYILDIDAWQRDRIDLGDLARWLDLLYRADARRTLKWLMTEKMDLLEFFLFNNVEVRVREHDQDPSDFGDDFFSLDGVFYLRVGGALFAEASPLGDVEKDRYRELVAKLLQSLAATDHLAYQALLLEAVHMLVAETEEEAYRLRNVRLAEKGLLPFNEAIGIYQPLKAGEAPRRKRQPRQRSQTDLPVAVPAYPAGLLETGHRFTRALTRLGIDADLEHLQVEFAGLCNRIIAADLKPVRSKDDLAKVVRKACGYLGVGLQALAAQTDGPSSENVDAALIERHLLEDIFRVGFGQALALRWRVQRWVDASWFAAKGLSLAFWGEAWLGILGGLLIKKPLYFDNYRSGTLYRDFADAAEIAETAAGVEAIIAMDALLSQMDIPLQPLSTYRLLTWQNLLLSLWAADCIGEPPDARPLDLAAFKPFYARLWQEGPAPRRVRPAMKTAFRDWLCRCTGLEAFDISERVGPTLERLFNHIEDEYGQVAAEDLDPRFVHLFLLEDEH
jgi:hypothetical protein